MRVRFATGALFALVLCGTSCKKRVDTSITPAPAIVTTTVQITQMPVASRRGAVSTGARLRLGFNAPGILAKMDVRTGDRVVKGQVLARLQDGGASASLAAAQAMSERARRDYGTAKSLAESGTFTVNGKADARSALNVANANTSLAAEYVSQRQLVSPITGTVVQRLAEPGETVGPGKPVLVVDDTELLVRVGVTEREVAQLAMGQPATFVLDGSRTSVNARIRTIGPAPLEDGLYPVELVLAEPANAPTNEGASGPRAGTSLPAESAPTKSPGTSMRVGTLLTVVFPASDASLVVRVPLDAIVQRDGKTWVDVVGGDANGTHVSAREIVVSREDGRDVYVASGLRGDERIVREAAEFLHDGEQVRVVE